MADRVDPGSGRGAAAGITGILLAAGRGTRFGGDKLHATLSVGALARMTGATHGSTAPDAAGECIGALSCRHLLAVLPRVIAVVRPDDIALAAVLGASGACIVRCANAEDGMGASLACGVRAAPDAAGWIIALADMPWVEPATIARVAAAILQGAAVAAPHHRGQRGHPVGFGATCFAALAALTGDDGAKSIVAAHGDSLARIDVEDAGTLRDVDRAVDLD